MSAAGARLRAAAARAVNAVADDGRTLDAALQDAEKQLAQGEHALLRFLSYGAVRHHWRLRAQVRALLSRPLAPRDRIIESLLAVGLLQLGDTRVAPHAAVSLTVEAARVLGRPRHAALVNAVLRRYQRQAPAVAADEEARYNHPHWMLARLRHDWPEHWPEIVAANNARAPMWLRVNERRTSRDDYLQRLGGAPQGSTLAGLDAALCLARPRAVDELPGFADGLVSVQDGAAQLAAPWLMAGGGRRILDACAAPGGKTGHLLELAPAGAALTAVDSDADRLVRVTATLRRLGLQATVLAADASNYGALPEDAAFDRILVDAPCSASGVIRRHPDIRLTRRDGDLAALAAVQGRMLDALWPRLEAGGRLLYVTCSVFSAENDAVVRRFLDTHADAREELLLPNNNIRALMHRKAAGFQILPGTADLDGFYFACLAKSTDASA
ncbi:MAG TPA: 16S rRNA (cytosine(967)-C(5))-methyltransferase RsmB [Woeseiaceae bacterium]|nr:16S rRNA (cytosine(967)-C(5))-methyltransferase RsmB [Woeseiaceae bacterium]